jgi:DNA-binding response OmpR family regulator
VERKSRILIVEDDETVSSILTSYLACEGFVVHVVADGNGALGAIAEFEPDLVILDVMLPGISGFEVCRRVRETGAMPIVVLSARGDESHHVMGLELGADDYIVKPFSSREVAARARAVLRRSERALHGEALDEAPLVYGELIVNPSRREATVAGALVHLTSREIDLLIFLMRHPGRAFRREELLEHVWGYRIGGTATVTVHVQRLREKIERDPSNPTLIATVWGAGYRFAGSGAVVSDVSG